MNDALKDLDGLMVKAREMVRLAGDLNERLTAVTKSNATSGKAEPDTATFIRSSLVQLGLQMTDVPVTLDMARDEKRWYEQLARELAGVLQGTGGKSGLGMMATRGIISLDEVWGGWNRARGVGKRHLYLRSRAACCANDQKNHHMCVVYSSPYALAILASITPPARIYRPNNLGAYVPRKWSTRTTYPDLHIGRLCRAFAWTVTHLRRLHHIRHCARGGCPSGSCRRDDRRGRSPGRSMSGRSGARRGALVVKCLPGICVGRAGHMIILYSVKSVLTYSHICNIKFYIERGKRRSRLWALV